MATSGSQPTLGDYLVREGIISQAQFNETLAQQRKSLHSIGRILVDMGLITEMMRITILQKTFGFELANLKDLKIDPILLTLIPYTFAEKHRVVPIRREGGGELVVGMEDPTDLLVIDAIKNQVGLGVEPVIASLEDIHAALGQYPQAAAAGAPGRAGRVSFRHTLAYRIIKHATFPIVALGPLFLFFASIVYDYLGVGGYVREYFDQSSNPRFEMFFYIMVVWGLWSIVLFEINGLIFGTSGTKEEEDY